MDIVTPGSRAPDLALETLAGSEWVLGANRPTQFSMLVAYRGMHCPVCKTYIRELDRQLGEFEQRGVDVFAYSCDTGERARETRESWGIKHLDLGYGMTIPKAREWGLFISTSRGKTSLGIEEPAQFSEPGLFLVRPDQTLYASSVNTMPFARPHFKDVLAALDFIIPNDYPARGEA